MKIRTLGAALVATVLVAASARAEVRVVRVPSKLLGGERVVHVSLPPNYDIAKQRYAVTYVLDGHVKAFFDLAVASVAYDVAGDVHAYVPPPQIVVGVDQRDRGQELGVNQELFTRFLVEELVPFIEHEFRTSGYRTLIGHSLGGRFALMTFCRAPGVFPSVIAISPAGSDSAVAGVERCLRSAFASDKGVLRQLVISGGSREARTLAGVERLGNFLKQSAPPSWRTTTVDATGLAHSETPFATIPPGVRFIQDGSVWEMPAAPADSIIAGAIDPERAVADFYARLSARTGVRIAPTRKWLLASVRAHVRRGDFTAAESAAKRTMSEFPEDLEAYGLMSDLALRRGDRTEARRTLEQAQRILERSELFDVYDRERKLELLRSSIRALQ